MDCINLLRLMRDVGREARRHGYNGDLLADRVPLVGTFSEQIAIATIGCDCSRGPMSSRDRELLNRLVRAAVLTTENNPSDRRVNSARLNTNGKPARRR